MVTSYLCYRKLLWKWEISPCKGKQIKFTQSLIILPSCISLSVYLYMFILYNHIYRYKYMCDYIIWTYTSIYVLQSVDAHMYTEYTAPEKWARPSSVKMVSVVSWLV